MLREPSSMERRSSEAAAIESNSSEPSTIGRRGWMIAVALLVGYAALSQYGSLDSSPRWIGAALSIGPVAIIGVILIGFWFTPWASLAGAAVGGALLYRHWSLIEANYEWADCIEQCSAYVLIASSFARSLFGGRMPLCTKLAAELHAPLAPIEIRYGRRATIAWALFYLGLAVSIAALFRTISAGHWNALTNFGTYGLIVIAAITDFGVRRLVLPRRPQHSVWSALRRALIG